MHSNIEWKISEHVNNLVQMCRCRVDINETLSIDKDVINWLEQSFVFLEHEKKENCAKEHFEISDKLDFYKALHIEAFRFKGLKRDPLTHCVFCIYWHRYTLDTITFHFDFEVYKSNSNRRFNSLVFTATAKCTSSQIGKIIESNLGDYQLTPNYIDCEIENYITPRLF